MKVLSKILLIIFGTLAFAAVALTIIEILIELVWTGFEFAITIAFIIMSESGAITPETSSFLAYFVFGIGSMFGVYDTDGVAALLIIIMILNIVSIAITLVYVVFPITICFITGLLAIISGATRKPNKGLKVANIVTGALCWYFSNMFIGLGVVLGGIFGLIAAKKEANKIEEQQRRKEEQPYERFGIVDIA